MCTFAHAKTERGVAQLVAFLVWDQAVAGSSPVTSTIENNFSRVVLFFCIYIFGVKELRSYGVKTTPYFLIA